MSEKHTVHSLQIEMDDLATGQLGPLSAWRLRRRIARDPVLVHEFAEVQELQSDLQNIAHRRNTRLLPRSVTSAASAPNRLKRRLAVAMTALSLLAAVTGAVAALKWMTFTPQNYVVDMQDHQWLVRTRFPGVVRIVDPKGIIIGRMVFEGGFPSSNSLEVQYGNYRQGLSAWYISDTFQGPGRHALRNQSEKILGYVDVSPLTLQDKQAIRKEQESGDAWLTAFYTQPEVFTEQNGFNGDQSQLSVAAGINCPGVMSRYARDTGLAWKVVGYAAVSGWEHPAFSGAISHWKDVNSYPDSVNSLPPSPLILREQAKQILSLAPPRHGAPRLYWQIADKNDLLYPVKGSPTTYHAIKDGHWRTVARSGVFTGYGRHEIKDEKGNVVLALRLSPLTPPKTAR